MRPARHRRSPIPAQFASLIVFAHLLVAAHASAHVYQVSLEGTPQHCAICTIGKHPASVPTAETAATHCRPTQIARRIHPPAPATRCLDGTRFARAPPSVALFVSFG